VGEKKQKKQTNYTALAIPFSIKFQREQKIDHARLHEGRCWEECMRVVMSSREGMEGQRSVPKYYYRYTNDE